VQSNLDLRVVLTLVAEREARLHGTSLALLRRDHDTDEIRRRPVRRWIGRQLVRFGTRLAGEPPMRPARAR
jgi:hypothetical protein